MLGDLLVKREGANFIDMKERIQENKNKWEQVVNSAGLLGPGESWEPAIGMKGALDPDRREIGRLWVKPNEGEWAIANGKSRPNPLRIWKFDNIKRK